MNVKITNFLERVILFFVFCAIVTGFWVFAQRLAITSCSPISILYTNSKKDTIIGKALFSPDDNIQKVLIGLIDDEREAIYGALYILTDGDIAHALVRAFLRGVHVEFITDTFCIGSSSGKAVFLAKNNIPVYVYKTGKTGKYGSLMHHKFFVFKKTTDNKTIVCTGSFNGTRSASLYNQENMIFIENGPLADAFLTQFERVKNRSALYIIPA